MKVIRIKAPVVEQPPDTIHVELTWDEATALATLHMGLGGAYYIRPDVRVVALSVIEALKVSLHNKREPPLAT